MTSLHDYESWLDELDTHLYTTASGIQCDYGGNLFFPYSALRTFDDALSTARDLSLVLLEEKNVNVSYLAKRFLRLAAEKALQKRDIEEEFSKHNFHFLTLEGNQSISVTRNDGVLEVNFVGPNPNHFVRLSRERDAGKSALKGSVRIERSAFADWHFVQFLQMKEMKVVLTPTFIVFDLPPAETWLDTGEGKLPKWRQHEAMRVALHHQLNETELQAVISVIGEVCEGLNFNVCSFNAMSDRYRAAKLA